MKMPFFFFLAGCSNFKEIFLMLWSFYAGDIGISLHKKEMQHVLEHNFLYINTYLNIHQLV